MTEKTNLVTVQLPELIGLLSPTFVLKHEGKYYVTAAVLEYDPKHPNMTKEQEAGVAYIRDLFEKESRGECKTEACPVPLMAALRGGITHYP